MKDAASSELPAPERAPSRPRAAGCDLPLTVLEGVGPARAALLERLGLRTVRDLLLAVPRRLDRFPGPVPITTAALARGEELRIAGAVDRRRFQRFGRRSLLRVELHDSSGSIEVLFFNQPWLRERFARGEAVELLGRVVEVKDGRDKKTAIVCSRLATPQRPLPAPGECLVSYPAVEGLSQDFLRALTRQAVERCAEAIEEPLPEAALAKLGLARLPQAVRELHLPRSEQDFERAARRVSFEAMLSLQARLQARRQEVLAERAPRIRIGAELHAELLAALPFRLTPGQSAVVEDLREDLARGTPMRRLLQGDVGSGKTALGLYACLAAARSGRQAAFMAPTELLAEQHFDGAAPLLRRAGVEPVLLTGSISAAGRRRALAALGAGGARIAFGTHALFSEDVRFRDLALAVIDEQHRFGVEQRQRLAHKGRRVHVLLMTATPIPRSLALTVHGDLEVSLLREKPPGRARIETRWVRAPRSREPMTLLEERLALGERAYWVVPRIGVLGEGDEDPADSADTGAEDSGAEERYAWLTQTPLERHGIELVHGRMPAAERARRLDRFRRGEVRLLVATTVIEVGVDVPDATVMILESAERLGLAQLHQLRGRVGRSSKPSWCLLLGKRSAAERLELLERTDDGFRIAEADLELRGMGDLAGVRQAGLDPDGLARAARDPELVESARALMRQNPALAARYLRGAPRLDA